MALILGHSVSSAIHFLDQGECKLVAFLYLTQELAYDHVVNCLSLSFFLLLCFSAKELWNFWWIQKETSISWR